ncbi:hypothetical protein B0H13DRAFT_2028020, partial [Mycena leptocephala]
MGGTCTRDRYPTKLAAAPSVSPRLRLLAFPLVFSARCLACPTSACAGGEGVRRCPSLSRAPSRVSGHVLVPRPPPAAEVGECRNAEHNILALRYT